MVLWEDPAPLNQEQTTPYSRSMRPRRTKSRCCQAVPLLCPVRAGTRRSTAERAQRHRHLLLIAAIFRSPAARPWAWELSEKSTWLPAVLWQQPLHSSPVSLDVQPPGEEVTEKKERKVQPSIGVTRGQRGRAGRRSFQIVFPQIKGVLGCSLLPCSSS